MIVRISKGTFLPDRLSDALSDAERALAASEAALRDALEQMPGLVHYYVAIDREALQLTNVSIWNSLEHATAMSRLAEMLAQRPVLEAAGVPFEPITNHDTLWTIGPVLSGRRPDEQRSPQRFTERGSVGKVAEIGVDVLRRGPDVVEDRRDSVAVDGERVLGHGHAVAFQSADDAETEPVGGGCREVVVVEDRVPRNIERGEQDRDGDTGPVLAAGTGDHRWDAFDLGQRGQSGADVGGAVERDGSVHGAHVELASRCLSAHGSAVKHGQFEHAGVAEQGRVVAAESFVLETGPQVDDRAYAETVAQMVSLGL
jgi:hypothetical protein